MVGITDARRIPFDAGRQPELDLLAFAVRWRRFDDAPGKQFAEWRGEFFLRRARLDIFGYSEERKTERALSGQYQETVAGLLDKLTVENLGKAIAIASIPEDIRGYGQVKERHLQAAMEKKALLLKEFEGQVEAASHAA
jgi:hypothetical protein